MANMKFRWIAFLLLFPFLSACLVNDLPRHLNDSEVMWIEVDNSSPRNARDLIIASVERQRFACRASDIKGELRYGCGQGPSYEDFRHVKGYCTTSPTISENAVCDVFFVSSVKTGLYKSRVTQPEAQRNQIELKILKATGAKRISRPVALNSKFTLDISIPRYSE